VRVCSRRWWLVPEATEQLQCGELWSLGIDEPTLFSPVPISNPFGTTISQDRGSLEYRAESVGGDERLPTLGSEESRICAVPPRIASMLDDRHWMGREDPHPEGELETEAGQNSRLPPRAVTPRMVGVGMVANVFQRRSLDLHFAI